MVRGVSALREDGRARICSLRVEGRGTGFGAARGQRFFWVTLLLRRQNRARLRLLLPGDAAQQGFDAFIPQLCRSCPQMIVKLRM